MFPIVGPTRMYDLIVFAAAAVLYLIELITVSRETPESVFLRRYCGFGVVLGSIMAVLSYSGVPKTDTLFQIIHSITVLQTLASVFINGGIAWANSRVLFNQRAGVLLYIAAAIALGLFIAQIGTFTL